MWYYSSLESLFENACDSFYSKMFVDLKINLIHLKDKNVAYFCLCVWKNVIFDESECVHCFEAATVHKQKKSMKFLRDARKTGWYF